MIRYRLTFKCLIKILILCLLAIFFVPLIFNAFDSSISYEFHKGKAQHDVRYLKEDISESRSAVLRSGILGNFEPSFLPEDGPGENGERIVLSHDEKEKADASVQEFGFNMVASDKISLTRNIPDTRLDECKYWHYPEDLPTASVIIVFHNEGFSTLLRTVHSVIKTSPYRLLKEVVMVDDFSDKIDLKDRLEKYIEQFNGLVKLYRNTERLGLIGTRSKGAQLATGDVIVFLDAHCECGKNWLVPLLARIHYNRTIMVVPTIDGIDWNDFHYSPVYNQNTHYRGIFEWGFLYKESEVPKSVLEQREHNSEPYKAPTHAGGLFAIDRKYFIELGMYDPGLQIWGGENFELSFKIWQCGGSIEWVPCSRVGHVYRNHMPYGFGKINPKIPVILINYMRVVEVWLDPEFREYFYTREPTIRGYPIGNISEQLAFKEHNKCKSFKWYMDNVAIEVYKSFPPPPPNIGWGEIKVRGENVCWDARGESAGGGPIGVSACHHMGGSQLYRFNARGQIGYGERCIDRYTSNQVSIHYCPVDPSGRWIFQQATGLIKYGESGQCAKAEKMTGKLLMENCNPNDRFQSFEIRNIKIW